MVKKCLWCGKKLEARQFKYCSNSCGYHYVRDQKYFGGNLKNAVGYQSRTCWVCGKTGLKKMHTHHVFGRGTSDDPLVVLCPGCHGLVSDLARRLFLNDPKKVAHIITLARAQAHLTDARICIQYKEAKNAKKKQ